MFWQKTAQLFIVCGLCVVVAGFSTGVGGLYVSTPGVTTAEARTVSGLGGMSIGKRAGWWQCSIWMLQLAGLTVRCTITGDEEICRKAAELGRKIDQQCNQDDPSDGGPTPDFAVMH